MKPKRLFFPSILGLGLALTLLIAPDLLHARDPVGPLGPLGPLHASAARSPITATTRYVLDDGGVDAGDCADSQAPCQTAQYAIGQAKDGDVVQVANKFSAAIYAGTVVITKSITLQGGWNVTPHPHALLWRRPTPCEAFRTTLDAGGAGRVISITGDIAPTIDCFTITGGDAAGLGGDPGTAVDSDAGGGIYSADAAPIIMNNTIVGNYGCVACPLSHGHGGGIYLLNAPATAIIWHNRIAYNVADETSSGQGGAIMLRDSNARVLNNIIEDNRAGHLDGCGGGIAIMGGSPTIADNEILDNVAAQGVQGLGGGVFVLSDAPVTIERNLIQRNSAIDGPGDAASVSRGGGIYYSGDPTGAATLRGNTIRFNVASPYTPQRGEGGGVFLSGLVAPSTVSENTIQENVAGHNDNGSGGGVHVLDSTVTVADNAVFGNAATWSGSHGAGGGLYVEGGTVLIHSNVITENHAAFFSGFPSTATGFGGGLAISQSLATLQGNRIVANGGTNGENYGLGGGIYAYSGTLHLEGNTIGDNYASPTDQGGLGGGVYVADSPAAQLISNRIYSNTADRDGGGVFVESSDAATLTSNQVYSNTATRRSGGGIYVGDSDSVTLAKNTATHNTARYGGGAYFYGSGPSALSLTLENNIVADNKATSSVPGLYVKGVSAHSLHTTLARNTGGDGTGVYVTSGGIAMTNTIIAGHTVGLYVSGDSTATLKATLWGDGAWANGADWDGTGTITTASPELWADPLFANPAVSDYHLLSSSPAKDAGVDAGVTDDVDGDDRPRGSAPDLGADEVSCLARVGSTTYPTIQQAVDAALSGETVQVAEGTCYENVSIAKTLTLEGGWDARFTNRGLDPASASTIDGMGTGRVISITQASGTTAVTIDGFTITHGDATGLAGSGAYGYDIGGGIYSWYVDTTISDCVITNNIASTSGIAWGGGVGAYGGTFTLRDSILSNNTASSASTGWGGGGCFRFGTFALSSNTIEGNVGGSNDNGNGGGLWLANGIATLQSNKVRRNTASIAHTGYGGGIYVYGGSVSLEGDVVSENKAVATGTSGYGGGVSVGAGATLTGANVKIYNNMATLGGGVHVKDSADATLTGVQVHNNSAGMGGGLYFTTSPTPTLRGSRIYNNDADYGGGILINSCDDATLSGNQIHDNEAAGLGGGLFLSGCADAALVNNMIVKNRLSGNADGAGILLIVDTTARFVHTTVAHNNGGGGQGVYASSGSTAWMTNTIVASHTVGIFADSGCTVTLETTLWYGNWAPTDGVGTVLSSTNISGYPAFADSAGSDFHLTAGSAAADQGANAGVGIDIDGQTRPSGAGYDLGADELWHRLLLPFILRNY